jgi:isoleucyl-tRNA synthetase
VTVGDVELGPEDVDLVRETAPGWGVASEGGVTVALDVEPSPDLVREGLARDLVRVVQDARKAAGLEMSQRIELGIEATGPLADAVAEHRAWIAGEVLATSIADGTIDAPTHEERRAIDGAPLVVTLRPA